MKRDRLNELLLQSLEHERGGIAVYTTALECAVNDDLREEWDGYLTETRRHEEILVELCNLMEINPDEDTPGRRVVQLVGASLVEAMEQAMSEGDAQAAELVAAECVTLAETKDHLNWELLGKCAAKLTGSQGKALKAAVEEVEEQEDEHLYHTKGWCRELWIEWLGMKAVLPPPEERKHVKSAIGAARAEIASRKGR